MKISEVEVPPADEKGKKGSAHKRQWRSPTLLSAAHQPQLKNTPTGRQSIALPSGPTPQPPTRAEERSGKVSDSRNTKTPPTHSRRTTSNVAKSTNSLMAAVHLASRLRWQSCGNGVSAVAAGGRIIWPRLSFLEDCRAHVRMRSGCCRLIALAAWLRWLAGTNGDGWSCLAFAPTKLWSSIDGRPGEWVEGNCWS